jgi:ABC transporter substrate binding protein
MVDLRRRHVITLLSVGVTWPFAVHAQHGERKRRIGALWQSAADDPTIEPALTVFRKALEQLGWSEDRNVIFEYRFSGGISDRFLPLAQELIALQPDVIVSSGTPITSTLQRETRTIPIVFIGVSDPIGAGFIASLARPGGNMTGVLNYEAQRDRAARNPRGSRRESKDNSLSLFPACSGSRSFVARYRTCASYHRELGSRHRARYRVVRSHGEWRLGRVAGYDDHHPSRPHHRARGPEPSARNLPISRVCRIWRSRRIYHPGA